MTDSVLEVNIYPHVSLPSVDFSYVVPCLKKYNYMLLYFYKVLSVVCIFIHVTKSRIPRILSVLQKIDCDSVYGV